MTKKIYVGNLPHAINDAELKELFESYGSVSSAQVIINRDTGRSKGFGFVEMENGAEADKAIEAMHESEVGGRTLTVNEARPRVERSGGGGGGGGDRRRNRY